MSYSKKIIFSLFLAFGITAAQAGNQQPISPAQLPYPTASTLGGVKALLAPSGQFLTGIGTNGLPTYGVPSINLTSSQIITTLGYTPANSLNVVTSFDTRVGAITLTSADVTNALGYTPAGASSVVTSFNTRTNAVVLSSADVTTALGYTPVASFNTRTGAVVLLMSDVLAALGYTPLPSTASITIATYNVPLNGGSVTLASTDLTDTSNIVRLNQNQTFLVAQRPSTETLTLVSNAATPDFDAGSDFVITLTCACTMNNPSTTLAVGQGGTFRVQQDLTGGRTISTWGSDYKFPGNTKPTFTTTPGAYDVISYKVTGPNEITMTLAAANPQ